MRVPGVPFVQGRNGYADSDGRKYGIAIHNTSNDATAEGEASYATRRTDGTSSHFYVDGDSVIQSLDTNVRAGHAGSRIGNDNAIAFEITGTNAKTRQWWLDNVAWPRLAQVCAVLCREYGIEPRRASVSEMVSNPKVRAFYGHDDMRRAWGGTTHTDPGSNFPWDHLFAEVKKALAGTAEEAPDMDATQARQLAEVHELLTRWRSGMPTMADGERTIEPVGWRMRDEKWQATVTANLAALLGKDWVDEPAIVAGVLAGLTPERIAAAIPAALTEQVADELARRMAADPPPQS